MSSLYSVFSSRFSPKPTTWLLRVSVSRSLTTRPQQCLRLSGRRPEILLGHRSILPYRRIARSLARISRIVAKLKVFTQQEHDADRYDKGVQYGARGRKLEPHRSDHGARRTRSVRCMPIPISWSIRTTLTRFPVQPSRTPAVNLPRFSRAHSDRAQSGVSLIDRLVLRVEEVLVKLLSDVSTILIGSHSKSNAVRQRHAGPRNEIPALRKCCSWSG